MAIKIPQYEDQTSPQGLMNVGAFPRANLPNTPDFIGSAISNFGKALGEYEQSVRREQTQAAVVDSLKGISDDQLNWTKTLNDSINQAPNNGAGVTDKILGDYDKYWQEKVAGVNDPVLKKHLTEQYVGLRNSLWHTGLSTEFKAAQSDIAGKIDSQFSSLQSQVLSGGKTLDQAKTEMDTVIANAGIDPVTRNALAIEYRQKLATSSLQGNIERDPTGTANEIKSSFYTPSGYAIGFVLKHEGSEYVPADSNGAPVRYGINGQYYPNEDIRNMSAARATEIYKRDYWDKLGLDAVHAKDPKLAMAVMDTAVLSGTGKAKELLDKSGGDVGQFLQLRTDFLNGLADSDPAKYGKYRAAWNNRTKDLASESGLVAPTPQTALALSMVKPETIPQWLNIANSEANRQSANTRVQVENLISDHNAMFMQGMTVNTPLTANDFNKAYGEVEGPARYTGYQQNMQMGADIQTLKTMPIGDQAGFLEARKPDPAQPNFDMQTRRYDALVKTADMINTQRSKDPIGWAVSANIGGVGKLDMSNPEALGGQLNARVAVGKTMRDTYGSPLQVLTMNEQAGITAAFQRMTPPEKEGYLKTIAKSVKDPEGFRAIMQQIAPDSPVTAIAAQLMTKDYISDPKGSLWWASDTPVSGSQVARTMLEGEALINPSKASKDQNGKGPAFPMPTDKELRDAFNTAAGEAFAGNAEAADFAFQGVKAYYAGKSAQAGDYSGNINNGGTDRLDESIRMVLGGVSNVGSSGKVFRPWGMDESTFRNAVESKFHEQMTSMGLGGSAWDNSSLYRFQSVGEGRYMVANNNEFVRGNDGKPMVIDVMSAPNAQGEKWAPNGLKVKRGQEINQIIGSLTDQEKNLVAYHEQNMLGGTSGKDDQGNMVSVYSTTIRIPDGEKNAGKFVTVPGYVVENSNDTGWSISKLFTDNSTMNKQPKDQTPAGPTGTIITDENALYSRWKSQIDGGQWPIYPNAQLAEKRAQFLHQVMDYDAGAPTTPGAQLPGIPMRPNSPGALPLGSMVPKLKKGMQQ